MSGSLGKIAKGTTIAFAGMLIFNFFEFITRVIIARYTTQGDYGAYSIGLALLSFFVFLSCLGLQAGVPRCIAYFIGKRENEKVAGVILSSLQLSTVTGIFLFALVFVSSGILTDIFHLEQTIIVELFAIAIPFLVVIEMLASIFTGFGNIDARVYFRDSLMSILKGFGIILAVILGFGFIGIIYAYLFSIIAAAAIFTIYAAKKLSIDKLKGKLIRKKLIYFSTPLLITFLSTIVITRTDTLMLGYFKTSDIVGLYNTASPIAQLLPIFLTSLSFIFIPISSQLYSKNLIGEMRRNYIILTKWVAAATLPFFFIIFLFPDAVLNIIFGSPYVEASDALRILAIGALVQVLTGPNALILVVVGKTKLNMVDDLIGAVANVVLNLFLIPIMGIIGAAIASTVSLSIINILKSAQIFWMHKINPFTFNFIKPLIASTLFVYIIYMLIRSTFNTSITIWMLLLFFVFFSVLYGACMILTKSFDKEDILMLKEIKKVLIQMYQI